jgi:hypothetical protein
MSDSGDRLPEKRPWDPAGTQPKHDPDALLPDSAEPVLPPDAEVVESDAIDEDGGDLLPERHVGAGAPAVAGAAKHGSSFAPRFQFITGALVAVGIAAIVGIAVLIIGPSTKTPEPAWSPWKPTSGGTAGATQIAEHVAPEYTESGQQLVKIDANDLSFQGIPLTVALQTGANEGGRIQIHSEKGVLYQLCGLTSTCAIDQGKASVERGLLMRRAAFELALYTFRYLKGVKQVVVLTPPVKGKLPTHALYFQRDRVSRELDRPLTSSLAPKAPSVDSVTDAPDTPLVHEATHEQWLFTLNGQGFNNGGLLVLKPYTAAADAQLQKDLKAQRQAASGG